MPDTIINMDYRMVDVLNSDQLEVDDLIDLNGEIVKVISLSPLRYGFALTYENEFGEKDIIDILDDETFDLYILE
jgi:hypothetical protein